VGMFAPSDTARTPFSTRRFASLPFSSFWVAEGNAQSASWDHRGLWSAAGSAAVKVAEEY